MSRKSDVLNKTWTVIDEEEATVAVKDCSAGSNSGDDINNNTKCIPNNETYSFPAKKQQRIINTTTNVGRNNSLSDSSCSGGNNTFDLETTFQKIFNIDRNYMKSGRSSIDFFIQRALNCFDAIQSELFFDATLDRDNEDVASMLQTGNDIPQLTIPQSFDVFLSGITTSRKSVCKEQQKSEEILPRSVSDIDLTKNLESNLSSASTSAANLLEVITSSPLKKRSFFGSTDDNADEQDDRYGMTEDDKERGILNSTYTSLSTNEDQLKKEVISQNLNEFASTASLECNNQNSNNLNRTFSIEDKKSSGSSSLEDLQIEQPQLQSLPATIMPPPPAPSNRHNETIVIAERAPEQAPFMSLPVKSETQQKASITTSSNSKIPKPGGSIPRISRIPYAANPSPQSTSSSTSSTMSSLASSSASISTASTVAPKAVARELAEVKNQNLNKPSLTTINKKSPQQLPRVQAIGTRTGSGSEVTITSKENKLTRPTAISGVVRNNIQQITSPNTVKAATTTTKTQSANQNNGEVKRLIKPGSMIPSFKPPTTAAATVKTSAIKK